MFVIVLLALPKSWAISSWVSQTVSFTLSVLTSSSKSLSTNFTIKQRQAEGIRIAKEKGVRFGRPNKILPPNTNERINKYINYEINNTEVAKLIGVSRGTFFWLVKAQK